MPEQIENKTVVNSHWTPMYIPVCKCQMCDANIYAEDYYYDFDGDVVCEECHRDYVKEHFRRCAG